MGAGTAGCVLANRLSIDPQTSVLLLEARVGTERANAGLHSPAAFAANFRSRRETRSFETEPQLHLSNRDLFHPRGKVLGGSSSINAMVYMRGHPQDFDNWAAQGCSGVGSLSGIFCLISNAWNGRPAFDSTYHGRDGPIAVGPLRECNALATAFVEAGIKTGFAHRDDFNGENPGRNWFSHCLFQRGGERESAATAYLKPARGRKNLHVETNAFVQSLSFAGHRARGVRYRQGNRATEVLAGREVILSAGAIQSPQILLLSGIGPAAELTRHGVPIVWDSPDVGRNLQDHLLAPVAFQSRNPLGLAPGLISLLRWMFFPHRSVNLEHCRERG